ncbi:MAG: hypothetical protein NW215_03795 [Hyphomicrobiales bacterium]|nr:hypothetical protein [Hyphomicrobiales bacterium]
MSQAELNILEREVEEARIRVVDDIMRLRSPQTIDSVRLDLSREARQRRDEWVGRARDAALDQARSVWDDILDRVSANPLATMAIAAGLGWRLYRHPPVATLLVGGGLFSLMRTNPREPSRQREFLAQAANTAGAVRQQVEKSVEGASQAVSDMARQASDMATSVTRDVQERVAQTTEAARRTTGQLSGTAGTVAKRLSGTAGKVAPSHRDAYLLGLATLAVATALGIAYKNRMAGPSGADSRRRAQP